MERMKKLRIHILNLKLFLLVFLLLFANPFTSSIFPVPVPAFAETQNMTIHVIYQGSPINPKKKSENSAIKDYADGGDAVLLESDGEFLLMDTGSFYGDSADRNIRYVKEAMKNSKVKTKSLSVYISHFHSDHTGGINKIFKEFSIKKLYLPSANIFTLNPDLKARYSILVRKAIFEKAKIIPLTHSGKKYVKGADTNKGVWRDFYIGDAHLNVIGALKELNYIFPFNSEGYRTNNLSLVSMITCGKVKYLTAGDIWESQETVLRNSVNLSADIMKLSHHGLRTRYEEDAKKHGRSNGIEFLEKVKPKISFVQTKGDEDTGELEEGIKNSKNYTRGLNSIKYAGKYGFCFSTTHEKSNFKIEVTNGKLKLFKDGGSSATKRMKGVVKVRDYYNKPSKVYISPKSGIRGNGKYKYENKYYYFNNTGNFFLTNSWKTIKSKNSKTYKYYFNSKGYMLTGNHMINKKSKRFDSSGRLLQKNAKGNWVPKTY